MTNHMQGIDHCGATDDGGAVLVIMKDRHFHAFFQLFFNVKAFGGFDVFEVDATKSGLQ